MTSAIPLFHCKSLDSSLDFYRAAGFAVTYEQREPYQYASVQQGDNELHLTSLRVYGAKAGIGAVLIFVDNVSSLHRTVADGLRVHYGRVPVAGLPRLTRLRPHYTRFKLFDPVGNMLIYINANEPEADYSYDATRPALTQALENAEFLRDTYANDKAAARALDVALGRAANAQPIEKARALAARAEIAVAMGEMARADVLVHELEQLELDATDRAYYAEELNAPQRLTRWLVEPL